MPMHIPSSIGTDSSRIDTPLFKMGPITTPLSPATQSDILGILQREQDHALSLLSLSPLLSSLFISYANQAAALALSPVTPSPESEEWKTLQTTIATLREENEKLKSENREMAEKLGATEASQEAFRSQVSSLKEVHTTQQTDIKSLWAELFEAGDKYDRLLEDSSAEKNTLQAQVLDLEVQRQELKDTIVGQQIKISKLERLTTDDALSYRPCSPRTLPRSRSVTPPSPPALPPPPPVFPMGQRAPSPSTPSTPILRVRAPLSKQSDPSPSLAPIPSFNSHGPNELSGTSPSPDFRGKSKRSVPATPGLPQRQYGKALPSGWLTGLTDGL